jgi:hypothetical protein
MLDNNILDVGNCDKQGAAGKDPSLSMFDGFSALPVATGTFEKFRLLCRQGSERPETLRPA